MKFLDELLDKSPAVGRVEWIGFAAESRGQILIQQQASVVQNSGIVGDHHFRPTRKSKRQVTLIQFEHLATVAQLLNREALDPALLRRNVVVSGINLLSLKNQRFRIGEAELQGSGSCPPCSRMEENLGSGGYAAMIGHGGITATVVVSGSFQLGDQVCRLSAENDE